MRWWHHGFVTQVFGLNLTISALALATVACQTTPTPNSTSRANDAASETDAPILPLGEELSPPPPGEQELSGVIAQMFKAIVSQGYQSRKDSGDLRPARRDAHAKHHGCVAATMKVDDVPQALRHGVFARPQSYSAIIRFSNGSFQLKPDSEPDAHGMAIKLLDVEGPKLLSAKEAGGEVKTQDFVMIDHPVFFMRTPETYISFVQAQSQGPTGMQQWAQAHPYEYGLIRDTLGKSLKNPLEAAYFSQTAYKLGSQAIKFSAEPCASSEFATSEASSGPAYLQEALSKHVQKQEACFDFFVQVQKDSQSMPVEDPTVLWPEAWQGESTKFKVATISIPAGQKPVESAKMQFCEDLSFTPWHSLAEHRPLGGVNRVRRHVYVEASKHRHHLNQVPLKTPKQSDWLWLLNKGAH